MPPILLRSINQSILGQENNLGSQDFLPKLINYISTVLVSPAKLALERIIKMAKQLGRSIYRGLAVYGMLWLMLTMTACGSSNSIDL